MRLAFYVRFGVLIAATTKNTIHSHVTQCIMEETRCCLYIQYTPRIKAAHLTDYRTSNPRKLYSLSIFYGGSADNRLMRYGYCAGHCLLFDIYFTSTVICKLKLQVTIISLTLLLTGHRNEKATTISASK